MQHKDTKSEDEISHQIIGASIEVHRTLGGPGLKKNHPIYETQVLTYLRLTGIKLGLLVNFGAPYVKDGISRIINGTL